MTKGQADPAPEMTYPITLDVNSIGLTDEQFNNLCRDNRDLRIELTARGELIIMPPTGSKTGWRNAKLLYRVTAWAEKDGSGLTFDSSTGFKLPNGAKRSPDVSWIKVERWKALTEDEQEGFAPLCPDFVIELRSSNERLSTLQDKMREYIENGAKLGWLIDPQTRSVFIYRPGQPIQHLQSPETVSGNPELSGLELKLDDIW